MGNFGPDFYSLAEDAGVARSWAGMPLVGLAANRELAADLIPKIQEAGARVVGQLSMTMHFGDHEKGLGLFGSIWDRIWTSDLLGSAPCADHLRRLLREGGAFSTAELRMLFHGAELEEVETPLSPWLDGPPDLLDRYKGTLRKAAARLRKAAFDEVLITHGRSVRPDLLLAQWYHKYDLREDDERGPLPASLWAKGENYLWYSQGPYKWGSSIDQGYLADMGLPARFMHAAGGGRPFVVDKYDYRRWRVWSAEAAAHGGAALAYHAGPPRPEQEDQSRIAPEDYYGPVIRYQRFMLEHEHLLHPATPWSQVALVYPRRAEREGDPACLDALKRLGEWLEDGHMLFDILLDEQLTARAGAYETLILPEVRRLSRAELELLERHVAAGGSLVLTGATGLLDVEGRSHSPGPLKTWRMPPGSGRVLYLPEGPWKPEKISIRTLGGVEMPVYPRLHNDSFGRAFMDELEGLGGGKALRTDAPWFVRVRAWRPEGERALVLHWINYLQDEQAGGERSGGCGSRDG